MPVTKSLRLRKQYLERLNNFITFYKKINTLIRVLIFNNTLNISSSDKLQKVLHNLFKCVNIGALVFILYKYCIF